MRYYRPNSHLTIASSIKPFGLLLVFLCVFGLAKTWAAGVHDEKYFIQLEQHNSQHNRSLEKEFLAYGRANELDIAVYYLDSLSFSEKQTNLNAALNEKFPIIIFQYYEPEITEKLIERFYKTGEFTQEGYMGGFVFMDSPISNAEAPTSDIALSLPFSIIGFDTEYLATEILGALDAFLGEDTGKVVLIADSLSLQEQSLSKQLIKTLQRMNKNNNHTMLIMSLNGTKENVEDARGIDNTAYASFYNHIAKEDNIIAVIAQSDENAFAVKQAVTDYNRTNTTNKIIPQIIGFGASPEAIMAIENKTMLLTFALDYKAYIKTIMELSKEIFIVSEGYVVTDAMIDDWSLKQSFSTTPKVFPVRAIRAVQ